MTEDPALSNEATNGIVVIAIPIRQEQSGPTFRQGAALVQHRAGRDITTFTVSQLREAYRTRPQYMPQPIQAVGSFRDGA